MTLQTAPERPAPVRQVVNLVAGWIGRLGWVWVEGEVAELSRRPGTQTVFLVLRDSVADVSVRVTCSRAVFDVLDPPVTEGARVVVHAKPDYYVSRGTFSLRVDDIRPVGLGELLARLERRRRLLAAEGLFDPALKRPVPFLPKGVGLVCGRGSAAERDVLDNARRRWPAVTFRVENAAVQGYDAVRQVVEALELLDRDPAIDVIVVARGGGSIEDLLPFSDEGLLRAVAACHTTVVSAIGHEQDTPLLDLVADVRASTPTDAAKRVVPDVAEQAEQVRQGIGRLRGALRGRLDHEQRTLDLLRGRPVLAAPTAEMARRQADVDALSARSHRCLFHRLERAADEINHHLARIRALSPRATLERGYAVLQRPDGSVLRAAAEVDRGQRLRARLADGQLDVEVV